MPQQVNPRNNSRACANGVSIAVRVQPRAKRNAVVGVVGEALKVQVTAPPEDGRANDAVLELIADWLGAKRRQIEIISGATNRNKMIRVIGVSRALLEEKLARL
jgi:uncharacterized protein (TIGR00251 family)